MHLNEHIKTEGGLLVPSSKLRVGGVFHCQHVRNGEVIDEWDQPNLVVNEGLDKLLSVMFNAGTQISTWYLGLFEGNYTPTSTVTAATIAADATECTAYDEAARPEYNEAAPSSQSITNSANRATFTFNASKSVYGAFLISNNTKGGSTGTLFSAARFSSSKSVVSSDELLLTYTFTAASA